MEHTSLFFNVKLLFLIYHLFILEWVVHNYYKWHRMELYRIDVKITKTESVIMVDIMTISVSQSLHENISFDL